MTTNTTPFTRDQLQDAFESVGLDGDEATIRASYSGRAMYGDSCFGIVHRGGDQQIGLAVLFSYDYLRVFHPVLRVFLRDPPLADDHEAVQTLRAALHR